MELNVPEVFGRRESSCSSFGHCNYALTWRRMKSRLVVAMSMIIAVTFFASMDVAGASTSRYLTSIWFSSPANGYGAVIQTITSASGSSLACTDYVGLTSDGGRRFRNFTRIGTWNCAHAGGATALTFDGAGDGFFYGPNLYESHDAGTTWSRVRTSGRVVDISTIGRSVWMIEALCTPQEVARNAMCPLKMQQSSDGGRNWSGPATLPGTTLAFPAAGAAPAAGQTILTRLDQRRGVYSIAPWVTGSVRSGRVQTWVTDNAGRSWVRRDITCDIPTMSEMLAISPSDVWTAVCAGEPSTGSQEKSVVRSTNQGRTWRFVTGCSTSQQSCGGLLSVGYLGVVSAPSTALLVESGMRSPLRVSRNGGRTWTSINGAVSDSGDGVVSIQFFGPRQGLGLTSSSNLIVHTADGGVQWQTYRARVG